MNLHAQAARTDASDALIARAERAIARKQVPAAQSDLIKENFYTEEELARVLRRCVRTLRLWYQKRVGPPRCTPPGFREILYSKRGVIEWLERSEQKPVREPRKRRPR